MVALTSLFLLLSLAIISLNHNSVHSLPAVASPIIVKDELEEVDSHPQYAFEYSVKDDGTGDSKHQTETRTGDIVSGQYSLLEPDGTRRTVDYTADHNGFNAIVTKHADVEEHLPLQVKPLKTVVEPVTAYKYTAPIKTARIIAAAAPVKTIAYTAAAAPAAIKTYAAYTAPVIKAPTIAYTAPAAYTASYTAPAYTAAYTSPAYTPAYTAAYTAPAYTAAYTAPAYTAAYTSPTYTTKALAYTATPAVVSHAPATAAVVSHAPYVSAAYAAHPLISHTAPAAAYISHSIYH